MYRRKLLLMLLVFGGISQAQSEEIRIAVASNFTNAMRAIAQEFEQSSKHKLKISYGSSGKFVAQIQHGAPFDVFFSADQDKVHALRQRGLIVSGSQFTYALGSLVLWSSKEGFINEANYQQRLRSGSFSKLAIANPKLAPYGLAAVQTLDQLSLKETTQSKWIQGENIAQTYQFVSSGNADLGFVALSQLAQPGQTAKGSMWKVPNELHMPIRQDAVLLKHGKDNIAAKALLEFLQSDQGRAMIQSYGYIFPKSDLPKNTLPRG